MLEAIRQWPVPFAYIPDEIIRLPTQPPMAYTGLTEGVRKSPIGSAKSMGYWTHYAIDRYLPLPALWSNTFWDGNLSSGHLNGFRVSQGHIDIRWKRAHDQDLPMLGPCDQNL